MRSDLPEEISRRDIVELLVAAHEYRRFFVSHRDTSITPIAIAERRLDAILEKIMETFNVSN